MKTEWEIIGRAIFQEEGSDKAGKECRAQMKRSGLQGKDTRQAMGISRLTLAHCFMESLMTWWITCA